MNSRQILLYLSLIHHGDWDQIYTTILSKEDIPKDAEKIVSKFNGKYITILDDDYPLILKNVNKPPFVIYYKGDISLINKTNDSIAVVGSRQFSSYGQEVTTDIVSKLAKKLVIVSGLARGIDCIAHQAALSVNGKTIAVLGCGIDICYPEENLPIYREIATKGLLISEYPGITPPSPIKFPTRNRIIAGLANTLLVTEGKMMSGTSITVNLMLRHGGNICCVPTQCYQESLCNYLIANGAYLVENADDVLFIMDKQTYSPIFKSENK